MNIICKWLVAPLMGTVLMHAATSFAKDAAQLTAVTILGDRMVSDAALNVTWADAVPPTDVVFSLTAARGSAQAWVASLNAKNGGKGYGGYNDWRLATGDGSRPYSPVNADNELASLFFTELGNTLSQRVAHLGPFTALSDDHGYWSGSRFAASPDHYAWGFNTGNGFQFRDYFAKYSAMAVRTGQVPAARPPGSPGSG